MAACRGHDCSRLLAQGAADAKLLDMRLAGISFDDHKRWACACVCMESELMLVMMCFVLGLECGERCVCVFVVVDFFEAPIVVRVLPFKPFLLLTPTSPLL